MDSLGIAIPSVLAATAGVISYGSAYPRAQLFGPAISHTNSPKKLAITFDDGPNPAITPKLLDLFDRYNARATFFLIGKFVRECPDLTKELLVRGHSLGNHTYTHPNLFRTSPSAIREELGLCNEAITEATGILPKWFRPPYGLRNPWVIPAANSAGQTAIMWTRIPGDWNAKSVDWLIPRMNSIAQHAESRVKGKPSSQISGKGDILCLHDGNHAVQNGDRSCTLGALEYWLPRWRDVGLEFVTIDEAVRTPAL